MRFSDGKVQHFSECSFLIRMQNWLKCTHHVFKDDNKKWSLQKGGVLLPSGASEDWTSKELSEVVVSQGKQLIKYLKEHISIVLVVLVWLNRSRDLVKAFSPDSA